MQLPRDELWPSPRPWTLSCFAGEPNTLFRSNSLASKSMESFLKVLHQNLLLSSQNWEGWCSCAFPQGWDAGENPPGNPGGVGCQIWPITVPCAVPRQVTGMPYLHFVLGPTISRVFEEKKYVELDPSKVEIKDVG